jgi:hypothetical protein
MSFTQPAGTLNVKLGRKALVVASPAGRMPAPSLGSVYHGGNTTAADGIADGEADAIGDGDGVGEAVPPTFESDGRPNIAKPATATTSTAPTAAASLMGVFIGSLQRRRH